MSNNIFFERGQMADKPNNYLWNGDCLELMQDIPDKSIDAIICDLPYGTTACKWDIIIPFDKLWDQYERIIKQNGAIVLFGAEPFSSALRMSNIKSYRYDWIWQKNNVTGFANAKKMPLKNIENISVFYNKLPTYNPQGLIKIEKNYKNSISHKTNKDEGLTAINGGRFKDNYKQENTNYPRQILKYDRPSKSLHRTQKPLELLKYLVKTYTNENDWVLDNTCGSNTTGIACYDLNRNYIGIEKDIDIYNVAKKRVEENILLRANK